MIWVVSWSFEDQGGQETYDVENTQEAFAGWWEDMICEGLRPTEVVKLTFSRPDVHLTSRSQRRRLPPA